MRVTRVVANLPVGETAAATSFYAEVFGFTVSDDFGWIGFLKGPGPAQVELHTVTHDASAPQDSVISIGVDDVDEAHRRVMSSGAEIVHGPVVEPWGVYRFFFRDPDGNVINVVGNR